MGNNWRRENPDLRPDLSGAYLRGARLIDANLSSANLSLADLGEAELFRANLRETDLRDANLSAATLSEVDLGWANLIGANLRRANLSGAYLNRTNLWRANLNGADFTGAQIEVTNFADVDLSVAKSLETIRHDGPSTIGIDTIYKSHGKIPEAFLRGCGVPDEFIAYIGSMVGRPIEFYSCFISYSTKDQDLPSGSMPTCKPKACAAGLRPTKCRQAARCTSRSTRRSGCMTSCC